jgi:hypothetical protein
VIVRHPTWSHLVRWVALVSATTVTVVLLGGTTVWRLERDAPGSNLRAWGDAIWWSVTTITTTGYGEHYPVTVGGRVVAVAIMICGITIIGAVAAIVAYGFAGRLAQRIEDAMAQMEGQGETGDDDPEDSGERPVPVRPGRRSRVQSLRALTVGVADSDCAASLTWLLARLGWHPTTDEVGLGWHQGGVLLRLAVRPWDVPSGIQGRLTFSAGSAERLARIARESSSHGFRKVSRDDGNGEGAPVTLRTTSGFEVVLVGS